MKRLIVALLPLAFVACKTTAKQKPIVKATAVTSTATPSVVTLVMTAAGTPAGATRPNHETAT